MLYRKAPPTPPRLLLRIVAAAGATALVGACSSSSNGKADDEGTVSPNDSGSADRDGEVPGINGSLPCAPPNCGGGSVAIPYDAASETSVSYGSSSGGSYYAGSVDDAGPDATIDAGQDSGDAELPCGTGVCGSIVMLDGGGDH